MKPAFRMEGKKADIATVTIINVPEKAYEDTPKRFSRNRITFVGVIAAVVVLTAAVAIILVSIHFGEETKIESAKSYLVEFGYISSVSTVAEPANFTSEEAYVQAIKLLQKMGNIPETGVVDKQTVELMQKPRCGVKDVTKEAYITQNRRKRYVRARWNQRDLNYRVINYTPYMSPNMIRYIFSNAFKLWSDVTPLTFTETNHFDGDILISFEKGNHNDGAPFDGTGSVLAHAFPPGGYKEGDTHFDDAEKWTFRSSEGVDLFMVAVHEFGHALGLDHSSDTKSVMYPWYQAYVNGFRLASIDVAEIQKLYGPKFAGR